MVLDLDDPRPPYQQVASLLRAAILTRKYEPGQKLPSGSELAKYYGVARMTVQQAIRILRDEGLVITRQGSGVFVRERSTRAVFVSLRPHIEQAFTAQKVIIDFAGFSGETLHGALQEPLEKIREGRLAPESISIRVLVPDTSRPWALPCRIDDLSDDPAFRQRAQSIHEHHIQGIRHSIQEIAELGLVAKASVHVRTHGTVPLFKLYIINEQEVFFGFYPVNEHIVSIDGEQHEMYDLMGKDTVLFHHEKDADETSTGSRYVTQSQMWFDSMWNSIGRERVS